MPRFEFAPRTRCVCGIALPPLCQRRTLTRAFAWGDVTFRRCAACHTWCQAPEITLGSISCWYDSDEYQGSARLSGGFYANYLAEEVTRRRESHQRWERDLRPLIPNPGRTVLEVGCASGSLLAIIRDAGHDVVGLDLSVRFARAARQLNDLHVVVGDIHQAPFAPHSFDLILLFGTISNLHELARCLEKIHLWLKPGGHLVANFPAADSLTATSYGSRHWMFAPSVNTFMSRDGLRRALSNAGFGFSRFTRDRQWPSWSKVATLGRIPLGQSIISTIGLKHRSVPFPIALPGIYRVCTQKG